VSFGAFEPRVDRLHTLGIPAATQAGDSEEARVAAGCGVDVVIPTVFDVAQGIGWPPGYPGRALVNGFWRRWSGREDERAASADAGEQLAAARRSANHDIAYIYAGQGVGLLGRERSATAVVASMAAEAEGRLAGWASSPQAGPGSG
jgi:nitronate monooxygenase